MNMEIGIICVLDVCGIANDCLGLWGRGKRFYMSVWEKET